MRTPLIAQALIDQAAWTAGGESNLDPYFTMTLNTLPHFPVPSVTCKMGIKDTLPHVESGKGNKVLGAVLGP